MANVMILSTGDIRYKFCGAALQSMGHDCWEFFPEHTADNRKSFMDACERRSIDFIACEFTLFSDRTPLSYLAWAGWKGAVLSFGPSVPGFRGIFDPRLKHEKITTFFYDECKPMDAAFFLKFKRAVARALGELPQEDLRPINFAAACARLCKNKAI